MKRIGRFFADFIRVHPYNLCHPRSIIYDLKEFAYKIDEHPVRDDMLVAEVNLVLTKNQLIEITQK